jgi:uncharacterized protein YdeI (YjbR/CyaY-like superfamily)
MSNNSSRVDAYIAKAAEFAKPILSHLREAVHQVCPDVVEEMKWGRPFFVHRGVILCGMAAFKQHCSFMFWGAEIRELLRQDGLLEGDGMGSFGKIASLHDLPPERKMRGFLRRAVAFIDDGQGQTFMAASRKPAKPPKAAPVLPPEFLSALKKNTAASKVFAAFSPSCRREYVEWIAEAKKTETRDRRIQQAVGWISEGKQRNWKYMAGPS